MSSCGVKAIAFPIAQLSDPRIHPHRRSCSVLSSWALLLLMLFSSCPLTKMLYISLLLSESIWSILFHCVPISGKFTTATQSMKPDTRHYPLPPTMFKQTFHTTPSERFWTRCGLTIRRHVTMSADIFGWYIWHLVQWDQQCCDTVTGHKPFHQHTKILTGSTRL
jgi:hypothetical protein